MLYLKFCQKICNEQYHNFSLLGECKIKIKQCDVNNKHNVICKMCTFDLKTTSYLENCNRCYLYNTGVPFMQY